MPISKPQRAAGGAALATILSVWAVAAGAQPQDTAPPPSPGKPPMGTPAPSKPSQPGRDLVGLSVFSSDGTKVGDVSAVNVGPSGNVAALHVKIGGFLGFGGRIVAIPEGAFSKKGPDIRLSLSEEEVDSLPEVKKGN